MDAVYVGLTHNLHADLVRRALLAGKAVLCEKPMAVCAADARALADLAREKNLLLMEGMWTRCMPAVRRATQWVQKGVIGPVRLLRAAFCFDAPFDPQSRLFNPDLCGGALLDAGVYPIEFAMGSWASTRWRRPASSSRRRRAWTPWTCSPCASPPARWRS